MPPARGPITQQTWPSAFPVEVRPVISAIVGGAPFARSLTALPTARTAVVFPLVDDVSEPAWGKDLDLIPPLDLESGEYDAAVSRLSGSILISQESISDTEYPVTQQVEQVLQDKFSSKLDRDFIGGAGPFPTPTGILAVAAEVGGADLELAAVAAKAEIGTHGGEATSIAMSPALIGTLESARDEIGRSLYPDAGTTFAGLETIRSVAATQAIVYDASRLWLVINRDFSAEMSAQASEAWNRYAQSLRIVGRFALAAPMPAKSVRKLTVAGPASAGTHAESAKRAARS
jgi:HK97 family phage major capsid protein